MKLIKSILLVAAVFMASSLYAQTSEKTDSLFVNGACGMCKSRIQKTLKLDGISYAVWDTDSKMLKVTYDPAKITNDEIQKKVVAVGHDTEKYKAEDSVYNKLPGCCHYDRKTKTSDAHAGHNH